MEKIFAENIENVKTEIPCLNFLELMENARTGKDWAIQVMFGIQHRFIAGNDGRGGSVVFVQ